MKKEKENKHTLKELYEWQSYPLSMKIAMTKTRIREWVKEYGEDGVYISFSGGKDSTVLLDIAREEFPDIEAVFVDVPTQFPELKQFATSFPNVTVLHPKVGYKQVVEKYGFPFVSKEVCECVQGAKRYLTELIKEANLDRQTDRQTDRQGLPYGYWYDRPCGSGNYARPDKRGEDNRTFKF